MLRIGDMLRHLLTKLEWFATLFPRIPVPIQKEIERRLAMHPPKVAAAVQEAEPEAGPAASTAAAADGRALSPEPRRRRCVGTGCLRSSLLGAMETCSGRVVFARAL